MVRQVSKGMNDKMRAVLRLRAMERKRVWGGGGITGSSPVMTGLAEFYLRGKWLRLRQRGMLGWAGNGRVAEIMNGFADAALRMKARQGLEGRRRRWRRGFVGG